MSNKFLFTIPTNNKTIDLPIEIKWDFYGRDDSIELYEDEVIKDIIGSPNDFEILRFAHSAYSVNNLTDIKYDFYFFSGSPFNLSNTNDWSVSYLAAGFNSSEIYYYRKPFTNSFFKLDFYDTPESKSQTNYFTIIIPVQQGFTQSALVSPLLPSVNIKKPSFSLDYVGDKEGFFIYWLRKKQFINLSQFYMSAKFFDAKLGVFVKMMNAPQSTLTLPYGFDEKLYFYYKVVLNYDEKTYSVLNLQNQRVDNGVPIKWYEYVNP